MSMVAVVFELVFVFVVGAISCVCVCACSCVCECVCVCDCVCEFVGVIRVVGMYISVEELLLELCPLKVTPWG